MNFRLYLILAASVSTIVCSCVKSEVDMPVFSDEFIPNQLRKNVPDIRLVSSVYAESGVELIGSCKSYEVYGGDYYFLCSNDAEDFSKAVRIDATHYSRDIYTASFVPSSEGRYYLQFCADNNGMSYIHSASVELNYSESGIINAVDLGLPSGIMWSSLNVGAESFEDFGSYFAWGETAPKTIFTWRNYKWCNGSSNSMIKYCTSSDYGVVDEKEVLEADDDAASVLMGGRWRMPERGEFYELYRECNWCYKTLNGVDGILFTSRYNGNGIFLPCAGYKMDYGSSLSWPPGSYWSSDVDYTTPSNAYEFFFSSPLDHYHRFDIDAYVSSSRYIGRTIRPVWDTSTTP